MSKKGSKSGGISMSEDQLNAIKYKTRFSSQEIKQWWSRFKQDFPTGEIAQDEFIKMYCQACSQGDAKKFAILVFNAYDADKSGTIDFEEFMLVLSVSQRGSMDEKLKWAFKMYDINGDGELSRKEATEVINAIYRMKGTRNPKEKAEEAVEQIFLHLDKNRDDVLCEEEFITGAKSSKTVLDLLK